MTVAIVDYGMGNLRSVANALDHLSIANVITGSSEEIHASSRIVLPGVGAFGAAMKALGQRGLVEVLNDQVLQHRKPVLGICLGMQLLMERSSENGLVEGFGWIPGQVTRIDCGTSGLSIPHIGWNETEIVGGGSLFANAPNPGDFYYVHSYSVQCSDDLVAARCTYGANIVAAIEYGNIFGTQFHPEKSQGQGLSVLKNFAEVQL